MFNTNTKRNLSENPLRPTLAPGERRAGRPIRVTANIFPMKGIPNISAFQYDVAIVPEVPPKVSRQLWAFVESKIQARHKAKVLLAYDGRSIAFSTASIGEMGEPVTVTVEYDKNAPTGDDGVILHVCSRSFVGLQSSSAPLREFGMRCIHTMRVVV